MNESWIKQYWRPIMAYQYVVVCAFDFIIFPMLTAWFSWKIGIPYTPWQPLTLKESGFYHMAMGAIVGVSAWTRGQEKITKLNNSDGDDQTTIDKSVTSQTPTKDN